MMIIGCDFHTRYQQIAMMDEATGELIERRLDHESGEAQAFYRDLQGPVRVGIEATGPIRWFERLLAELGHELWIGDSAKIRASEIRKQKTDERDALLILDLLLAKRFPKIWVPTPAERDLRQLLWHRHKLPHLSRRVTGGAFEFGTFDEANLLVYDGQDRTTSANCGSIWSQTFTYADAFGNLTKNGNSSFSASYSPSTNRMTSIGSSTPSYDANGNVTNDFLHTYSWNAEGRPVTIDGMGATYDALGRMVEMNRSGTYTEIVYSPTGGKLALMTGQTLQRAFVSLPGGATAVYTSSGLDHYRHSDWLGSARLLTTPNRTESGDVAYAPYGETYAASGNNDFSWTGINADAEPANPETLYDFPAREYGIQGRWPSPDPAGLLAVDPSNPQSWDRYAYVDNNPLAVTDPTGTHGEGLCYSARRFALW